MDIAHITDSAPTSVEASRRHAEARRAAQEFEALLLNQITSALVPSEDEDEESLFSSGAGGVYHQMFGEEIARAAARGGGVGIADLILKSLKLEETTSKPTLIERAREGMRLGHTEGAATEAGTATKDSRAASEARPESIEKLVRPRRVFADTGADEKATETHLKLPLWGRISSFFGLRRDPLNGRRRHHAGVDLAAPRGTRIEAAGDGKVVFAGKRRGYGNTIIIEHADGRRTLYAHAERLLVHSGERVREGQTIATVGSTGRATGPHLHFEVIEAGRRVDPLREVEGRRANDLATASR